MHQVDYLYERVEEPFKSLLIAGTEYNNGVIAKPGSVKTLVARVFMLGAEIDSDTQGVAHTARLNGDIVLVSETPFDQIQDDSLVWVMVYPLVKSMTENQYGTHTTPGY